MIKSPSFHFSRLPGSASVEETEEEIGLSGVIENTSDTVGIGDSSGTIEEIAVSVRGTRVSHSQEVSTTVCVVEAPILSLDTGGDTGGIASLVRLLRKFSLEEGATSDAAGTVDTSEVPIELSLTREFVGSISTAFFVVSSLRREKRALSIGLAMSETAGTSTRDERAAIS